MSEDSTYRVDGVQLPVGHQVGESERVDVLVDGQSDLDEKVHDHETFGTNLEGQDFDSVGDEETRPSERIGNGEDPDHGNDTLTSGLAAMLLLLGRANSPDNEADTHGCCGRDKERAATDAISEQSARNGNDK
jgi:hypothetical protein